MTTPMNKADDGVHRLVDMVVEEVSLVDRAANASACASEALRQGM